MPSNPFLKIEKITHMIKYIAAEAATI